MFRRIDFLSALVGAAIVVAAVLTVACALSYGSILQTIEPGDSPLPTDRCPQYRPTCHIDLYPSPAHWHLPRVPAPSARADRAGTACDRARRLYRARHYVRTTCRRARADYRYHLLHPSARSVVVGPFSLDID